MKNKSWYQIQAKTDKGDPEVSIHDAIGEWGVTAKQFLADVKALGKLPRLTVRLNTPGGSVFDGLAIYNVLRELAKNGTAIETVVDGIAASMGSILMLAGDVRRMPANTYLMIHNPSGGAWGEADDMRKTADLLDKVRDTLADIYTSRAGIDREQVLAMMAEETWLTGVEAGEQGFATEVTDALQLAASWQANPNFDRAPSAVATLLSSRNPPAAPAATDPEPPAGAGTDINEDPEMKINQNPADGAADEAEIRAKVLAEEQARRTAVQAVFAPFAGQHKEVLEAALADMNCSEEDARKLLLTAIGKQSTPTAKGNGHMGHVGNGNIVRDGMTAALLQRAGIKAENSLDNPYNSMSLPEMARASLVDRGVGVTGYGDRMALVGAAFTHSSSDFGSILADVANKSMLKGYEEADETFQQWTQKGELTDFKPTKRVDLNTFPALDKIPESGEYKYGTMGDRGEQIVLATFGKLFTISRQAIINDDLRAFTKIPQAMGRAAIRTVGNLVYAILTSNPAMSDGKALFHADHKNVLTTSPLSVANLDKGRTAMARQKDPTGNTLNIRPGFLIVPMALNGSALSIINAEFDVDAAGSLKPNTVRSMATVIADARLDDDSETKWYLAAGQAFDTIEVAYLNGIDRPFLEEQAGFTVDGASFKVRMDAGVAPIDFRTLLRATA